MPTITPFNFHSINISPSLRGASATRQSRPFNIILDCFASLAMTILGIVVLLFISLPAFAATSIPFTINLSKSVNVTGTPRIAVDVGGVTRYATYASGSGTSALTFTYAMVAGDVDLDGVTVSSPIQLNGGTIKDASGNDATLTFTPPNTTNVKVNYPSLGMDFVVDADGRYTLNGTPYNDLPSFLTATGGSFTRGSIGTYFDSAGVLQTAASGVPRFDYDPATHTAKGILIEESRTNYATQSQTFLSDWSMGNNANPSSTITPNSGVDPNGSNSASLFTPGIVGNTPGQANTNANRLFQEPNGTNINTTWSLSIYVKTYSTNSPCTLFVVNKQTDTPVSQASITTSSSWQRLTVTGTTNGGTAGIRYVFASTYPVLIYGAQLEQGAFSTSYIPTTSAAVTRAADNLYFASGTALTQFQSSTGAFLAETINLQGGAYSKILSSSSSGLLEQGDTTSRVGTVGSGGPYFLANLGSGTLNAAPVKSAVSWSGSTRSLVANGGTLVSSTGTMATRDALYIGSKASTGNYINGYVKLFKFYPLTIPDTQLQLMTQ